MAGGSGDHIIEIIIETTDRTAGGLNKIRDKLLRFDQAVQRMQERIKSLTSTAYDVTIRLIDRVTPEGSRVNSFLHRMTDKVRDITLRLNDGVTNKIREAEAKLFRMTEKAYTVTLKLKDQVTGGLKGIGDNVLQAATGFSGNMIASAGIGYGVYDTIKTHQNFEAQMSNVGAIAGLDSSSQAMKDLTEKAMEMGAKTAFSATEAGKAFEYMAMAGWKTEQMMGGISGIMNLAAASGEDLGNVSDIVTDALTAFGMQAEDSARFADVLAKASSNANTNVGMMGYTFKYVAPLAGALKYSIEEVATSIGLMANAGIKGEQAGTSLRAIMTRLVDPPKEAGSALDRLAQITGTTVNNVRNADGTMKPWMQTMKELRFAFSGLTDAEKAEYASSIAGQEAMSGFLAMVNASEEDFNKLYKEIMNSKGAAEEMSKTRLDNLAGDLTLLGSAWETLQLRIMNGKGSNFLREIVQGVKEDVEKFTKYIEDGLDISDIGKIAMDVITQLKDKFLKLDGVGSILAGGLLIGALGKITSKAIKLIDVLKDAAGLGNGAGGGSNRGGSNESHGGSVGTMTVHANVVNVNGRGSVPDVGTGGGAGRGGSGGGPQPPGKGGGVGRFAKGLGIAGTVLSVGSTAYDVYSTKQYNEQMTEEADWGVHEAQKKWSDTNDAAYTANEAYKRGEITLEERDKAYDDWAEAQAGYNSALDYQKRVEGQNETRDNTAMGGAVGSVAGAVIGGAIGSLAGPVGTAIGSMVGSTVGSQVGEIVGANWEPIKAEASNTAEWIGNKFKDLGKSIGDGFDSIGAAAQNEWDYLKNTASETAQGVSDAFDGVASYVDDNLLSPIRESAQNEWEYLKSSANDAAESFGKAWDDATDYIDQSFLNPLKDAGVTALNFTVGAAAEIGDAVSDAFSPVADYIDNELWEPLKDAAQNELDYITGTASEKADELSKAFGEVAAKIEEDLWEPLKEAAQNEWEYIANAASERASELSEAYSEAVTYFDEEVWTPLKDSAAEMWAEIAELPGEAAAYVSELWGGVSAWFSESVWAPLGDTASAAWTAITETAGTTWDAIVAYFEPAASWFDATVWQPISSAVDSVRAAITNAFEAAWSAVTGIWREAGNWFEQNVISPVRNAFNSIVERGASITGLSTGGGQEKRAFGGFVTSPRTILAGEDGGEVIIPLSPTKRGRAIGLFERTAEILNIHSVNTAANADVSTGYQAEAFGGFVTSPRRILVGEDGGEVIIPLGSNRREYATQLLGKTAEILNIPDAGAVMQNTESIVNIPTTSGAAGTVADLVSDKPDDGLGMLGRITERLGGFGSIFGADLFGNEDGSDVPSFDGIPALPSISEEVDGQESIAPIAGGANGASVSVNMGGISISLNVDGGESPQNVADSVLGVIRENMERIADEAGGKMAQKLADIWGNQPMPT